MARIAFLAKNPKRALGSLAVLVAATGVVIGSGANFTASSANPNNSFAAGTLEIVNSKNAAAILSAGNLKPGDTPTTGTVDIENDGSLAGVFELERSDVSDSDGGNPMSAKLNLVVEDCGAWPNPSTPEPCNDGDDTSVYNGTVAAMTTRRPLGTFASQAKHTYEFSVQLDSSASDAYQGDTTDVEFTWHAVQS